jgi:N-acetylmuramic acid 6-phosphate etherase
MSTETIDQRFSDLDQWPTTLAVDAMFEGQLAAVAAVKSQVAVIAAAADAAALRLGRTGRLVYVGAGTSGRVAVQDGVELYPTYNWPNERLLFLMAGGLSALTEAAEGAEDDAEAARSEIASAGLGEHDVVIGVAASGRTPYTIAAIAAASAYGALTIGIANNREAPLLSASEHGIFANTGTEIVAGSTRMKAGTAQKAILNMLSTAIMLRQGLIYGGLMVNMRVSNEKLLHRAQGMVRDIAHVDISTASNALEQANGEIKHAVLLALGATVTQADEILDANDYNLRGAMESWIAGTQSNA